MSSNEISLREEMIEKSLKFICHYDRSSEAEPEYIKEIKSTCFRNTNVEALECIKIAAKDLEDPS